MKLKDIGDKLKKNRFVVLMIAVGLILILWPSGGGRESPAEDTALDNTSFSLAENERRLASILSQIEGAGRVEVMLTVTGSTERVIAEDVSRTETRQQDSLERTEDRETVILGSGSDQNVVELKLNYPKYTGAVVVADGAGSAQVRLEIVSAVSAATGLASDRISVSKMEKP